MSYKVLQLPQVSTRGINLKISTESPGSSLPFNYHEAKFSRSWLIYDPELDVFRLINRDVVLGMGLALVISASFWTGIGLAIAQVWK